MTLFEIVVYTAAAGFELRSAGSNDAASVLEPSVLLQLFGLSFVLMCSQGFGNASLALISFPLKVVFKSCKLVPAMGLGLLVLGKKYNYTDYGAAALLCFGLVLFTMGNSQSSEGWLSASPLGLLYISLAVLFDAFQPNLQEKLLHSCNKAQMIFYSNAGTGVLLLGFTAWSGELLTALLWCMLNPWGVTLLCVQATSGFLGLGFYLAIVKRFGGVNAV